MNTPAQFPLEGQVALVTGGSRGLGRVMVDAFADAGANVVIASRKLDSCEETAEQVEKRTGRRCLPYACHVGHWDEIPGLVDAAYGAFGRLDLVVNNAGMSPLYTSLEDISEELFDKTIGVNLKGPFRLGALAGARMKAAGGGSIINISSIAAVRPTPHELPYAAAKSGLHVLTTGLALAYGPEVRVNTIMAGPFLTDIASGWDMGSFQDKARHFPLRRAGQPEEIAGAALYLAGPAASYTTGALITVDGGSSIARL
ncbi:MAG TPA: glucose 1-dehydrogenase [Acidimicrobiales bacterium]|nr:glucose 1-dehydrogenase [Acidimicrobiales bacterium]